MLGGRLKELIKKYGKVAFGVHMSVSAASITGLYVAIKSNVDVESLFEKFHLPGLRNQSSTHDDRDHSVVQDKGLAVILTDGEEYGGKQQELAKNRTAELAASTGGALALALLCNKALFPLRVPITIALTPPIARFLARRNIIKNAI